MTRKKCAYCTFDPETHMGADFISGKPIDRQFINERKTMGF